MDKALELDSDKEYELNSPPSSVWITVGSVSVYIIHYPAGVNVRLYALGQEYSESELYQEPLDEAYVIFDDIKESNENLG